MSAKTLIRVAFALGVVLILWAAAELVTGRGDEIETGVVIEPFSRGAVEAIEFLSADDTVKLHRTPDGWTVNGFDAAQSEVESLFEALAEAGEGELVARSPSSHARMGVVDSAGVRLSVGSGEETLADVIVGKRGRAYQTRYVRREGDDRVFLVKGRLAGLVERQVTDWRDKLIVDVQPDSVARLTVTRGSRRFTLVRADSLWNFENGGPTDSSRVRRTLEAYKGLSASGGSVFATPEQIDSIDFAHPDRRTVLETAGGDTLAHLVFDSTSTGFWVRHDSRGTVYHLLTWKVNDLTPTDSVLRRKEESN